MCSPSVLQTVRFLLKPSDVLAFTFLLPAAGIAMVPAVGWLLDTRKQRDVALVMIALGVVFGILTLLPYTAAQLVGIAMLVSFRPLFYTAIS